MSSGTGGDGGCKSGLEDDGDGGKGGEGSRVMHTNGERKFKEEIVYKAMQWKVNCCQHFLIPRERRAGL